jgi:Fe-S-cluster containining protein
VPVTGADILRIERDLSLSFWDFACRWADPQGTIARKYAPHFHFADEPQTPFVICLMHDASSYLGETTKCRFLMECAPDESHPLGVARCGIYHTRPMACRAFPTKLNQTAELAVIHDVPACGRAQNNPAYDLCPRPWEPSDFDPLQTVQDLVVAMWNRALRPWSIFPEFLRMAYAGRVVREDDSAEADEPQTIKLPLAAAQQRPLRRAA